MIKGVLTAIGKMRDSWTALIFPVLSDLLFLVFLGFLLAPFFNMASDMISLIGTKLIEAAGAVTGGVLQETLIKDIITYSPDIPVLVWKLVGLLGLILLMIYLLTTAFQAVSWYFCQRIAGKRTSYYRYFIHIAKVNIIWVIIFGIVQAIDLIVKMNTVLSTPAGVIPQSGILMNLFYVILIYLAFASYSGMWSIKKYIQVIFSREYSFSWIMILLWFTAVLLLQSILPAGWVLFLQIFVTLPSITFSRILLIGSTRKFI